MDVGAGDETVAVTRDLWCVGCRSTVAGMGVGVGVGVDAGESTAGGEDGSALSASVTVACCCRREAVDGRTVEKAVKPHMETRWSDDGVGGWTASTSASGSDATGDGAADEHALRPCGSDRRKGRGEREETSEWA